MAALTTRERSILIALIDSAKVPAAAAVVEILQVAVTSANPRMCLHGVAAVLLE